MRQVSGAVQAGQSVREVHPGSPQERQQRVLQAQEQPPAGGVGAHDGVVQPRLAQPHPHPPLLPVPLRLGAGGQLNTEPPATPKLWSQELTPQCPL